MAADDRRPAEPRLPKTEWYIDFDETDPDLAAMASGSRGTDTSSVPSKRPAAKPKEPQAGPSPWVADFLLNQMGGASRMPRPAPRKPDPAAEPKLAAGTDPAAKPNARPEQATDASTDGGTSRQASSAGGGTPTASPSAADAQRQAPDGSAARIDRPVPAPVGTKDGSRNTGEQAPRNAPGHGIVDATGTPPAGTTGDPGGRRPAEAAPLAATAVPPPAPRAEAAAGIRAGRGSRALRAAAVVSVLGGLYGVTVEEPWRRFSGESETRSTRSLPEPRQVRGGPAAPKPWLDLPGERAGSVPSGPPIRPVPESRTDAAELVPAPETPALVASATVSGHAGEAWPPERSVRANAPAVIGIREIGSAPLVPARIASNIAAPKAASAAPPADVAETLRPGHVVRSASPAEAGIGARMIDPTPSEAAEPVTDPVALRVASSIAPDNVVAGLVPRLDAAIVRTPRSDVRSRRPAFEIAARDATDTVDGVVAPAREDHHPAAATAAIPTGPPSPTREIDRATAGASSEAPTPERARSRRSPRRVVANRARNKHRLVSRLLASRMAQADRRQTFSLPALLRPNRF